MIHKEYGRKITLIQRILLFIACSVSLAIMANKIAPEVINEEQKNYPPYPHIEVITNLGNIYLQLDGIRAPISTRNFLEYIESGHYDNTIFHRVIPGFMAQAGGYDTEFSERGTRPPIYNESGNGLSNMTGTLAMARTNDPHSATSQFYINVVDNKKLDPRPDRWGYTVFGEVLYGMPLVQDIVSVKTGAGGDFSKDVPVKPIIIKSMRVMSEDEVVPIPKFSVEDFMHESTNDKESEKNTPAESERMENQ